jgi:hypothetical protein
MYNPFPFGDICVYGGFLKWRVALYHPFIDGFSVINHPFWDITIYGTP